MELTNTFTVPADIDTAWKTLLDVEAIAPCMPGATLESVTGDQFTGNVKVKLGPVSMVYGGEAQFLSKDAAAHRAVIEGTGKEARGSGTAKASVTIDLVAESPTLTRVEVVTDLTITGKAAQFGRGVMQDVAGRLVTQFAGNLETLIGAQETGESASGEATAPAVQSTEALDLGTVAMGPVLKRVVPVVIVLAAVIGVVWYLVAQ
ncbi:MAG: SRPBCC family protein [Candidatus Nanopelagicales bacterium]|nr:SRPBCC family protein [Candidatus Nanopelagicales bacterium]